MIWIALPIAIALGIFLGLKFVKRKIKAEDEACQKAAMDFIHGKRENSFDFEGKKIKADSFILRNENNKDVRITFSKGKMLTHPTKITTTKAQREVMKNEPQV